MHGSIVSQVVAVVTLLLIAALAAIVLRRLRLPYTVGLVALGIGLAALAERVEGISIFEEIELSPAIILFVFLPTLIFESAFNLDFRLLSKNLLPVLVLAAPGLLISTFIVGALVAWLTPLDFGPALLFGALISATDPVAVVALFKELGAPKRLAVLVEGESLFNDATAIVLFQIILATLAGGVLGAGTIATGLKDFVLVFFGGLAVGALIGYLMVRFIAMVEEEPLVEVALSTVVAYAAFVAADHYLHVSGVMATVGAGVVVGTLGNTRFSKAVRTYLHHFWEYAGFVANSFIFLLVGLAFHVGDIWRDLEWIGWTIAIVVLARAVVIFTLVPAAERLPGAEPVGWKYQAVLFWGGLRGAVALALAFSLAPDFPSRDLIVALAFGVVLFSILGGGMTMPWMISALGLNRPSLVERLSKAQAEVAAKREALQRLDRLADAGPFSQNRTRGLRSEYHSQLGAASSQLNQLRAQSDPEDVRWALWSEALIVERAAYQRLFEQGAISEAVLREVDLEVDLEQDGLRFGRVPRRPPSVVPLEVRISEFFHSILARVSPRSRRVERHRLRALSAKYEHLSAEVEASRRVVAAMSKLEQVNVSESVQLREIAEVYRQRETDAFQRLDSFRELFPEYVTAVENRTCRRIALDGEADAIEDLAAEGQIPPSVAREARQAVEEEQRRLLRQVVLVGEPKPEDLLRQVPLFDGVDENGLSRVAERLVPMTALAGEVLLKQGEPGDALFLIARGVVAVLRPDGDGPPRRVATLHQGDFFGEIALLGKGVRTADVQAVTDCQFYRLFRKDVDATAESVAGFRDALEGVATSRLEAIRKLDQL